MDPRLEAFPEPLSPLEREVDKLAKEAKALREENARLTTLVLNAHGKALPARWVYTDTETTVDLMVAEITTTRYERDQLRAQNGENKRYLDAISQALHPHKPADGWTYLPDQLAGMVEGCMRAMDLGRTQTKDAFYRISNQQDELLKLRADLDAAIKLLREADGYVRYINSKEAYALHAEIGKFLKEHT